MPRILALRRKYPNRVKYLLMVLDVIAMIIAIKVYVNYVSIETAIEDATQEQVYKTDELAFTQNFLINYEKSPYAQYFLEHENNMLMKGEYIIKFEDMYAKQQANSWVQIQDINTMSNWPLVNTPQWAWKKYLNEKTK